ncbi:MSCRAMM family protein [Nafulsella turpanensis]|uniref:MSCRAMM family protein n=1 Tax=Nafulsella turpanensis TaxID=1265690 RepID=UPI000348058C|nr:carboxypeptidase-like regulatory domain-containing protein [Nafulsella turpanensis]
MKKSLLFLTLLLVTAWGCSKEDEEPATGVLYGTVTDAATTSVLENVRIIVFESNSNNPVASTTTGADGAYSAELLPGSYYLKLYRQGYDHVPPRNISPIPFTVSKGMELDKPVSMNLSEVENGGYIHGKVVEAEKGVPGVLVVGVKDGKGYSAVSDAAGEFFLYNLPAGSYTLKGWRAGYESEQASVNVTTGQGAEQIVNLSKGAAGSVSGTLSFLASTAVEVDVALTHPLTEEAVPGLQTKTSANYTIENVPAGTFLARATYQNDQRVVDPDWIVKFGEPLVEVSNGAVSRDFSLTNSVSLIDPTNPSTSTIPLTVSGTNPTFSWTPYSSASDYVIEVSDANGNVIWGGFDYSQDVLVKKVSIPSSQTSVEFNFDQTASKNLEAGKVYRWKIYASKDDKQAAAGWKLISVSEDQLGLITIGQ